LSFFLFAPVLVGFILWEVAMGMPQAAVGSSVSFFPGLALAWFAVIDRTRRYYAGTALPLVVFGLVIPFCDPRQIRAGVGLMVIAIGLATAAIQTWQLRCEGRAADGN
jgi:hypothetical protein